MTESATSTKTNTPAARSSRGWGWGLLVLIYRLLLLGVSSGIAFLIGMAIASVFPGSVEEPPFVERVVRRIEALVSGSPAAPTPVGVPAVVSPSPALEPPALPAPPPAEPAVPESQPPLELSQEERDRLQAELDQLEADLQSLRDRAAALESDLGTDQAIEQVIAPLEQRVQQLRQRLDPSVTPDPSSSPVTPETLTETPSAAPTTTAPSPFIAPTVQQEQSAGFPTTNSLIVTLPLDVLFATDTSTLPPQSTAILDSVVSDLLNYPGAVIQVTAHADNTLSPVESRIQSFEQAKAVQTYLANVLNEDDYHWIVVGYGQTRPAVLNATSSDRQRNRRLEITIHPR